MNPLITVCEISLFDMLTKKKGKKKSVLKFLNLRFSKKELRRLSSFGMWRYQGTRKIIIFWDVTLPRNSEYYHLLGCDVTRLHGIWYIFRVTRSVTSRTKICRHVSVLFLIGQQQRKLGNKTHTPLWSHFSTFLIYFPGAENVGRNFIERNQTHLLCSIHLYLKVLRFST